MAYAVGLLATHGCLVSDHKTVAFVSGDRDLVVTLLSCVNRPDVRVFFNCRCWRARIGDVALYRWLLSVGLTPRKSLTLGAIDVPEEHLLPLVRGLLDGDGSVLSYVHNPVRRDYPAYRYPRLTTVFYSASRAHLEWLAERLRRSLQITGFVATRTNDAPRHDLYALTFGKHASTQLLSALYRDRDAPCLERKREVWDRYRLQQPTPPTRAYRRTMPLANM